MLRKDGFFGLHFDFHAGEDSQVGRTTTAEAIERYLEDARPDYVQCDCKGHRGLSSYPTKVGYPAKIEKDNLKIWREVTRKYGIPLIMHYSGVWDVEYLKHHPEDHTLDAQKNPVPGITSVFSPYVDRLLIPQLKELIDEYEVDGVWVDGDCWALQYDYSAHAQKYFPPGMTHEQHGKVMRDGFVRYVNHYAHALHAYKPDFQIASNWAYSSYIPEQVEMDLDFLSGDFTPTNAVNAARYEGRCLCTQGLPWDLMDWSFFTPPLMEKTAEQLKQDAAQVLALGGGFQLYITQNRDGSAKEYRSDRYREVADFCRKRQPYNHRRKPMAQVGLFYSAEDRYRHSNLYNAAGATDALRGTLEALLDAQMTVNIVMEHQLDQLSAYDAIVFPEWKQVAAPVRQKLLDYANQGGNLVVVGAEACSIFASAFSFPMEQPKEEVAGYVWEGGLFSGVQGSICQLPYQTGEPLYQVNDLAAARGAGAAVSPYGNGTVTAIPFCLGTGYYRARSVTLARFFKKVLAGLMEIKVTLNQEKIDVVMQPYEGKLLINLINMRGEHGDEKAAVYDEVPVVTDLEVTVLGQYTAVSMPLAQSPFTLQKEPGKMTVRIERLHIHDFFILE